MDVKNPKNELAKELATACMPEVYPEHSEEDMQALSRLSFHLSTNLLELYFKLLKRNELDLSAKMLNSGIAIREKLDNAFAEYKTNAYSDALSEAFEKANETRYWLQRLQKKFELDPCFDGVVEKLNKVQTMLNYHVIRDNEKLNVPLPFLN